MSETDEKKPLAIRVVQTIFYFGPLIFAFGFLMPLIAQLISSFGWQPPFGLSPLQTGFVIAAVLGGLAQIRGRWV